MTMRYVYDIKFLVMVRNNQIERVLKLPELFSAPDLNRQAIYNYDLWVSMNCSGFPVYIHVSCPTGQPKAVD